MSSATYFAIGDIHGESGKLADLHDAILDRIAFDGGEAVIVHLGDYVDRGPDSQGVIERVMALEARFADHPDIRVVSLMGNHERMMLDALDHASLSWLTSGGRETLESYGLDAGARGDDWAEHVPSEHLVWMAGLPSLYRDDERKLAFVHAGIDPGTFPECSEEVRLWTRSDRFMSDAGWPRRKELDGLVVVHGHTPRSFEPELTFRRINVDTGACFGGPLTAVMLKDGEMPAFLRVK